MTATSRMSGTLWITERPGASRAAAISFRAEFLAPPTYTVPDNGRGSGPSETTRKLPMRVTLVSGVGPDAMAPTLVWGDGEPDPHLHAHRRRWQHPTRRHERNHQDRPEAARVRRR